MPESDMLQKQKEQVHVAKLLPIGTVSSHQNVESFEAHLLFIPPIGRCGKHLMAALDGNIQGSVRPAESASDVQEFYHCP
jgi:hypothetical protein